MIKINNGAFQHNDIQTILTPQQVQVIGQHAFEFNRKLETLIIISDTIKIESFAFYSCEALETIIFVGKSIVVEENAFEGCFNIQQILISDKSETQISINGIDSISQSLLTNKCGEYCHYLYQQSTTKLYIYGGGSIDSFASFEYKQQIKEVIIIEGIRN